MYEWECATQNTTISQIKEILESFNSDTNKLCATNRDMQTYIGSCKKERIVYPEQKHLHFKKIVNIIANSDSITPQKKKMRDSEIERKIIK